MGFANKTYYEILDIDPAASAEEVRRSYTTVKAAWDPGAIATYSLYSPAESQLISRKIEEAFAILTDGERRRRYDRYQSMMERGFSSVTSPEAFWQAVEGGAESPGEGLASLTELMTSGRVSEEEMQSKAAPRPPRLRRQQEVERDWSRLIDEANGQGRPSAGRAAAAMEAPDREPPQARTYISPTAAQVSPGTGWKRPERPRAGAPRPTRLEQRPVSEQELNQLEAQYGLTGAFLGAVREAKGVSVAAIANHTKIGSSYIRDIEAESFGSLPPAVYLRGFVQQYVKLLGLDTSRVVAAYMARFEASLNPEPPLI